MEASSLKLTDLLALSVLQKLQDAFANATGVASIITEVDGQPITKPSNFCRLCNTIRATELGLRNCKQSDAALGVLNPSGAIMQPCLSGGLWDGGASITVGDLHIANWLIGQVRNEEISGQHMVDYAREIGLEEAPFLEAFEEVPMMSRAQFAKVCDALFLIANQISDLAFHNLALRQSESNLRTTLNSIGEGVIATDIQGRVVRMNPVAESLTGWPQWEAQGRPLGDVFRLLDPQDRSEYPNPLARTLETGAVVNIEQGTLLVSRAGKEWPIADSATVIQDPGGAVEGVVLVFRDVSEQMVLEEELRQSQKMEAIGQLAGGVAHDFNNLLQGILGASELLVERLQDDPAMCRLAGIITTSAEKAATLTHTLLDFSRRGKSFSTPIEVHSVIREALQILERSIDRKITIVTDLQATNSVVVGDPTQIQNAFINLGINARDAMPDGGEFLIATRNVEVSAKDVSLGEAGLFPGAHLEILVRDTGSGMKPEVLKRIFEPFFTTKAIGKGTGLGLASVYSTVRNHHGSIHVKSGVGHGAEFKILFPSTDTQPTAAEPNTVGTSYESGSGCILVVDDESVIRHTAEIILTDLGYRVLLAQDGDQGLEVFRQHRQEIDLAILDIVMPKMNGPELFQTIRSEGANLPIIFTSGFSQNERVGHLLEERGVVGFIQKPYRKGVLAALVEKAMKMVDASRH